MKKAIVKSSILAGLMGLLLCFSGLKDSKLTDITRPYLGEYQCERATYGSKDYLDTYTDIRLELKSDNTFVLTALDKTNKKKTIKGKYSYDEKKQTLTMRWGKGGFIRRKIPLNGGELCLTIQIGNKTLVMNFIQK
ncbi:MAG: hypothetical protein IKD47_02565 [Clostridia bacterium]|nr:hypothetical protein [Clostridia bacterium]